MRNVCSRVTSCIRVRVANKIFIALVATTSFLTFCAAISPPTPFSRACVRKRKPDTGSAPSYVVNNDPPMPLIASSPRKRHNVLVNDVLFTFYSRYNRSSYLPTYLFRFRFPRSAQTHVNISYREHAPFLESSFVTILLLCVVYLAPASRACIREI